MSSGSRTSNSKEVDGAGGALQDELETSDSQGVRLAAQLSQRVSESAKRVNKVYGVRRYRM